MSDEVHTPHTGNTRGIQMPIGVLLNIFYQLNSLRKIKSMAAKNEFGGGGAACTLMWSFQRPSALKGTRSGNHDKGQYVDNRSRDEWKTWSLALSEEHGIWG